MTVPRFVLYISALFAGAGLLLLGVGSVRQAFQEEESRVLAGCRARLAVAVTDAQVDRDLGDSALSRADARENDATAALILAIGGEVDVSLPPGVVAPTVAEALVLVAAADAELLAAEGRLGVAEDALRAARDARVAFEENPSGGC